MAVFLCFTVAPCMHLAEFIVHGVCSENSSCLFISFVDLSHLIPLNSHKYELLCLVRQGTCHDTLCPVKCARMRAAILSEPRQYGYPHLLIRENRSACLCGFILMGVYNPPCFPLGQDPDCFWWQPHWEFVFDLWVSSALGVPSQAALLDPRGSSHLPLWQAARLRRDTK